MSRDYHTRSRDQKLQHPSQCRKMRLASESAEEEETRLSRRQSRDRAKRAAQSSQATKNCRRSETAEARERRDRDRASRFRKRGGKGDTIIQRDVNIIGLCSLGQSHLRNY